MYNEITNAITGRGENNLPKCAVAIDKFLFDTNTKEPSLSVSRRLTNTTLNLVKIPASDKLYIQIDFEFPFAANYELNVLWDILREYSKEVSEITEDTTAVPQVFFTFVPLSLEGKYYILASAPLFWGLIADKPETVPNTIRIIFSAENVSIFETTSIDYGAITAIIDAELTEEEKENQDAEVAEEDPVISSLIENDITNVQKAVLNKPVTETEKNYIIIE